MLNNPKSLIPATGLIIWALLVELFDLAGTPEATGLGAAVTFLTTYIFVRACKKSRTNSPRKF